MGEGRIVAMYLNRQFLYEPNPLDSSLGLAAAEKKCIIHEYKDFKY